MKIAVYTSITAAKDSLKEDQNCTGADFLLFSDDAEHAADSKSVWNVHPACNLFADPRRNSRSPKFLAHQYLPDYDYSIWIDGSIRLLASARDIIDNYLGQADIALFRHPERDCAYDEAAACTELGFDDSTVISDQIAKYRLGGYPANNGLTENRVILRRHNAIIEILNNAWWSEYCRHSCRDQISLNYVLHRLDIRYALLPGVVTNNPGLVSYEDHLR